MSLFAWNNGIYNTVGVAVSGGVDSMCLLQAFLSMGQSVVAIHVEHGIRGQASKEDMAFVRDYCLGHNIPFAATEVDALGYAQDKGIGVEMAARELRYQYFEHLLATKQVDVIATAHHLDDQVETVLMHLLRGAGIRGLGGIGDREGYVRPMIGCTRKEILAYASQNRIPYREDSTNSDTVYRRNWMRQVLLPLVETRYPSYRSAIVKMTRAVKEQKELLDELALRPQVEPHWVNLPLKALDQPVALAKWSIYLSLMPLTHAVDLEEIHYEEILALGGKPNGTTLHLAGDVVCRKGGDGVLFWRPTPSVDLPFAPGRYEVGDYRLVVRPYREGDRLRFDLDKIPPTARLRTRAHGDFIPKFGGGTKSLGDYYTDVKLAYPLRELPVVAADHQVLVCPHDVAATVAEDAKTTKLYTLVEEEL